MPELPCPVGDFKASGNTLSDAALALSRHLVSQHCDAPTDDRKTEQSGGPEDLNVGLKDLKADLSAKGRV